MESIKVAIVEDIENIREAMQLLINGSEGFECEHVFASGEDALKELPIVEPDVVLMDINLPGISGIECVRKLKKEFPAMQFMMCTIYEDEDNVFEALKAGASGYILKKTSPVKLLEAIRDLHEGGSPMSSQIARRVVEAMHPKKAPKEQVILTPREKELLDYLSQGYRYKEIADKLFISVETVRRHVHNIYEKLQVQSRTDALNKMYPR